MSQNQRARTGDFYPRALAGQAGNDASTVALGAATLLVDDESVPWVPFSPYSDAVEFKYFRLDQVRSEIAALVRVPAGVCIPRHYHSGRMIVYTIEGRWKFLESDWIAGPGSTVFVAPTSVYTPQALGSEGHTVTLNIITGDMIFFTGGGDAPIIENWKSALRRYVAYCERSGIQPTDLTALA